MPPLRSIRSMRRICRKRRLRRDVARTLPWLPTATTGTEAISTKMSGDGNRAPVGRAARACSAAARGSAGQHAAAGNGDGDRAWRAGPLSRGRGGNATCQGQSKSP